MLIDLGARLWCHGPKYQRLDSRRNNSFWVKTVKQTTGKYCPIITQKKETE